LYRERIVQPLTSVIISSNRLYGGMVGNTNADGKPEGPSTPAALMTMVRGTNCSITGNVIVNRGGIEAGQNLGRGIDAPSLWLVVAGSIDENLHLAVTGNVLQGPSDLAQLIRLGRAAPFENWSPFNADPS
jgi:hypothetical protein